LNVEHTFVCNTTRHRLDEEGDGGVADVCWGG
jgi:hypothetical protein